MNRFQFRLMIFGLMILLMIAVYYIQDTTYNSAVSSVRAFPVGGVAEGNKIAVSPLPYAMSDEESASKVTSETQPIASETNSEVNPSSDAQKLNQENVKEPPRFESMSDSGLQDFLKMYTLGSSAEFLLNVDRFTQPLNMSLHKNQYSRLIGEELLGNFRSRFLSIEPKAQSPYYHIEIQFKSEKIEIRLANDSKIYYQAEIARPKEEVRTSSSTNLPVNFLLKFPAKIEYGYRHPLYLQLFVSFSREMMIGNLYLTSQSEEKSNYFLAEEMVFEKFSL